MISKRFKLFVQIAFAVLFLSFIASKEKNTGSDERIPSVMEYIVLPTDTPPGGGLPYPITDDIDPRKKKKGMIDLDDPSNVKSDVVFDPVTGKYNVYKKIGDQYYKYPMSFTLDEYLKYDMDQAIHDYWKQKVAADKATGADPAKAVNKPLVGFEVASPTFDRIFGGNNIDIRPQGSAEVTFGINSSRTDNPALSEKQRRFTNFDFKQRIQLNVLGSVGDKLKITTNYNTEATFDFENQVKLEYTGHEDEIIKKVEFGNVSLPLNSTLISGSQTLFGAKTQLQFGRLTSTTVFSSQRGKKQEVDVAGGSQTSTFELKGDEYEANKHYFLSQYFRNNYDRALTSLPLVNSGVSITRIEVWLTNNTNATDETRNIVSLADLGEDKAFFTPGAGNPPNDFVSNQLPYNDQNDLYNKVANDADIVNFVNSGTKLTSTVYGFSSAVHYEKLESARKLVQDKDYTVNSKLGFISLQQQPLNNDEVLSVAYEYTLDGRTYQVGQFSTDGITPPKALILKMLKPTITNPRNPVWDLMMKNVYSINAFQVNQDKFILNVFYNNPSNGVDINYLPVTNLDKTPLIQVLNADRLDPNKQSQPDGVFDFVDGASTIGGTINAANGRIFFPTVEPFGESLRLKIDQATGNTTTSATIAYPQLYDSTKIAAQQRPDLNRFKIKGSYRSAGGSEISLNALNIPQGSVYVTTQAGAKLIENVDYTVDYNLGRVKIINTGLLESQTPLKVGLESNSLFSVQQKTFIGQRFDYRVSKDFNLGATIINLSERPITPKVNFNEEPINNTMFGFDGNYTTEAPSITRLIDRLPFIETKEPSSVTLSGEYARLIPGHSKAIGNSGNSYIDDFEGSQSTIDLRGVAAWSLASVPQGQPTLFPEGGLTNNLSYGFKRAQLAWYLIDQSVFYQANSLKPSNINNNILSDHRQRQVLEQEVFPNRQLQQGTPSNISMFDLAYYPEDRGPYNFTTNLNGNGTLMDPASSWGGIMRRLTTTDFESNNIEFIQFWIMDPFNVDGDLKADDQSGGGNLYVNLGNISEDILKDSRKSFENGLPKEAGDTEASLDSTAWGLVPRKQSIVNAFANINGSTKIQDIGLDGLSSDNEKSYFATYLSQINSSTLTGVAKQAIQDDPANDNFHYYRGDDYDGQALDILQRYKRYNGTDGNSPSDKDSPQSYSTSGSNSPSTEDINLDNNLSESESYFQYKIAIHKDSMKVGSSYITSIVEATPDLRNGQVKPVKWYQFKIPVKSPQLAVNGIQDFRSIRFMRVFMKDFQKPVVLRFARMEFIRGEWRKYTLDLSDPGPVTSPSTTFDVGAVSLEENGSRLPINYVLPPDIIRETDYSTANQRQLNEQALSLKTCELQDGDARATFRNVGFDIRSYKKIQLYTHMEGLDPDLSKNVNFGDLTVFVRLGTDFDNNYYEYELPLTPTSRASNTSDPELIWPSANNMIIDFERLTNAKLARNAAADQGNANINTPYKVTTGADRITVKGNPGLNDVRTIMIGVRNPASTDNPYSPKDVGRDFCAEIWVNELRLTDFDEYGGYAAVARANVKLADLGALSVAGNISTPGFGSVEKRLSERQRETKKGIDASTNLELGKFLPEKTGIKIPVFLGFSESHVDPLYDPLIPDVEFSRSSEGLSAKEKKERLRIAQTFNKRRSLNFTNVRKDRVDPNVKPHVYDIENFSFTYSYSENFFRDINTAYRFNKQYRGGFNYAYTNKPKTITPFKNISALNKSKYLTLLSDFNFNIGPKVLGFRTNVDRNYTETQIRNNIPFALEPTPTYTKTFNWQRGYDLKYDITRSLTLDFTANNTAYIKETAGRVNKDDKEAYQSFKDTVWDNIKNLGITTNYSHSTALKYALPLKKFPLTDFLDGTVNYGSSYQWDRAPFSQDSLGNTIQNSQTKSLEIQSNMATLYNKVPYLKNIITKKNKAATAAAPKAPAKPLDPTKPVVAIDSNKVSKVKKPVLTFPERLVSFLMMTKTASVTFKSSQGTLLPGFAPNSKYLGMDPSSGNENSDVAQGAQWAPGAGFVFGKQDDGFFDYAASQNWLKKESELYQAATRTNVKGRSYRASLEPLKSMRVELNANYDYSENLSEFYRWSDSSGSYEHQSPVLRGNYSVSTITIATLFAKDKKPNFNSDVFEEMIANTYIISGRVADVHGGGKIVDSTGYYEGYSKASQEVMIPAFIAAYTGKDPRKQRLNPLSQQILPNWRVTYDGLSKLPLFAKLFKTFSLTTAYRSTYSTSYVTNLQADESGGSKRTGLYQDFVPSKQISTVSISENLAPLLKVDATLKNGFNPSFEIIKNRTINMSMANLQITELKDTEFKVGAGYKFKNVKFPFKISAKDIKSDLNLNVSLSMRNSITIIRKAAELISDATTGRKIFAIKLSADYQVNQRVTLRAYYDRTVTKPVLSLPFPNYVTNAGISIRFILAN